MIQEGGNVKRLIFSIVLMLFVFVNIHLVAGFGGEASLGYDIENNLAIGKFELNYLFNIWKFNNELWIGAYNYMILDKLLPAAMVRSVFPIGYRISYDPVFLELEHFCSHPYRWEKGFPSEGYFWEESGIIISIGVKW